VLKSICDSKHSDQTCGLDNRQVEDILISATESGMFSNNNLPNTAYPPKR